jgi:hypothetical protein
MTQVLWSMVWRVRIPSCSTSTARQGRSTPVTYVPAVGTPDHDARRVSWGSLAQETKPSVSGFEADHNMYSHSMTSLCYACAGKCYKGYCGTCHNNRTNYFDQQCGSQTFQWACFGRERSAPASHSFHDFQYSGCVPDDKTLRISVPAHVSHFSIRTLLGQVL